MPCTAHAAVVTHAPVMLQSSQWFARAVAADVPSVTPSRIAGVFLILCVVDVTSALAVPRHSNNTVPSLSRELDPAFVPGCLPAESAFKACLVRVKFNTTYPLALLQLQEVQLIDTGGQPLPPATLSASMSSIENADRNATNCIDGDTGSARCCGTKFERIIDPDNVPDLNVTYGCGVTLTGVRLWSATDLNTGPELERFVVQHWVKDVLLQQEPIQGQREVYNFTLLQPGGARAACTAGQLHGHAAWGGTSAAAPHAVHSCAALLYSQCCWSPGTLLHMQPRSRAQPEPAQAVSSAHKSSMPCADQASPVALPDPIARAPSFAGESGALGHAARQQGGHSGCSAWCSEIGVAGTLRAMLVLCMAVYGCAPLSTAGARWR
jgi:hypothetical protein